MGDKAKVLCKWSKNQYSKDLQKLREISAEPSHYCKDCGRFANEKKWLCKPKKLS